MIVPPPVRVIVTVNGPAGVELELPPLVDPLVPLELPVAVPALVPFATLVPLELPVELPPMLLVPLVPPEPEVIPAPLLLAPLEPPLLAPLVPLVPRERLVELVLLDRPVLPELVEACPVPPLLPLEELELALLPLDELPLVPPEGVDEQPEIARPTRTPTNPEIRLIEVPSPALAPTRIVKQGPARRKERLESGAPPCTVAGYGDDRPCSLERKPIRLVGLMGGAISSRMASKTTRN